MVMKILIVNPNSSEAVSEGIMKSARKKAKPTTEFFLLKNASGTKYIDCAFGDYMSTHSHLKLCLEKVKELKPDAVVLAGFGNVGVYALKEILDIPVVSIAEASMAVACLLGHKFSTIAMLKQFIPYQEDIVRFLGFEGKCASVRAIRISGNRAPSERDATLAALKEEAFKIAEEDHAEVIILAGAGLCGYEDDLSKSIGLPVLDPVVVGVKMAEMMVETGLGHSKVGKFAFPPQNLEEYF
jgi:allantoin racemase